MGLTRVWPGWGAHLCCLACRPGVAPVARGDGPRSAWAPDDRPDHEETDRTDHVSMLPSVGNQESVCDRPSADATHSDPSHHDIMGF